MLKMNTGILYINLKYVHWALFTGNKNKAQKLVVLSECGIHQTKCIIGVCDWGTKANICRLSGGCFSCVYFSALQLFM